MIPDGGKGYSHRLVPLALPIRGETFGAQPFNRSAHGMPLGALSRSATNGVRKNARNSQASTRQLPLWGHSA